MRKIIGYIIVPIVFCLFPSFGYSEANTPVLQMEIKTTDINQDGKPDVRYYRDGKYVGKVEVDTNYDGKPDVVIVTKDGKFVSAEVDTDFDGKPDKKFSDVAAYNRWLKTLPPDFQNKLDRADWQWDLMTF